MTTTIESATAVVLGLKELHESPLNPRKHFNPQGMAELTESVKAHGVLTPLLVRPARANKAGVAYEILAGARRYRAAKVAELSGIPCVVVALDDAAALEVMLIENLQRADVHPIEEARGFQQMMNLGRYTPTQLAAKMGKDESYVRRRVHLLKLFEGFQALFETGDIQLAHAQELCRLTEGEQRRAMKGFRAAHGWDRWQTPGDLRQWIENHVHMQLKKAAFPKNDAELVPAAGSCLDCPKRTGSSPMLFPDIKSPDICTDPACFNGKLDAFVKAETIRLREKGEPFVLMTSIDSYSDRTPPKGAKDVVNSESINRRDDEKACKNQEVALIVTGPDRGHKVRVCRKKGCVVHTYRSLGERSTRTGADRKRDAARKAKLELEEKVQRRALELLYSKLRKPGRRELILIGASLWGAGLALPEPLAREFGTAKATYVSIGGILAKLSDDQLNRYVACATYADGGHWPYEKKLLGEALAEHKIDLADIRSELAKAPKAKAARA